MPRARREPLSTLRAARRAVSALVDESGEEGHELVVAHGVGILCVGC